MDVCSSLRHQRGDSGPSSSPRIDGGCCILYRDVNCESLQFARIFRFWNETSCMQCTKRTQSSNTIDHCTPAWVWASESLIIQPRFVTLWLLPIPSFVYLRGIHFDDTPELSAAVQVVIFNIQLNSFRRCFVQSWLPWCRKCISFNGEYFEKNWVLLAEHVSWTGMLTLTLRCVRPVLAQRHYHNNNNFLHVQDTDLVWKFFV